MKKKKNQKIDVDDIYDYAEEHGEFTSKQFAEYSGYKYSSICHKLEAMYKDGVLDRVLAQPENRSLCIGKFYYFMPDIREAENERNN